MFWASAVLTAWSSLIDTEVAEESVCNDESKQT